MSIFDKSRYPTVPDVGGMLRNIATESSIPSAIGELLKSGAKPEDLMMRVAIEDSRMLNSWLDFWIRCVRYSEYSTGALKEAWEKKMQAAKMWLAGQVSIHGVGRKQAVQVATGVLHHSLYDERRSGPSKTGGGRWKFSSSDGDKQED